MGQGSTGAEMTEEQREQNRKQHKCQAKGKIETEKLHVGNAGSSLPATPTLGMFT